MLSPHVYSTRNTYLKKTSIGWITRPISALAAVSTLSKYIADLDEPFARKLEVVLTSFGRQTRLDASKSLRSTTLTDFFAPRCQVIISIHYMRTLQASDRTLQ